MCLATHLTVTQSVGAVEYTNCFSADGLELHNESPGYDTKKYNGEVSVILELWGMLSIPLLPLLSGPIWPGVVAPDRFLSVCQIELNCVLMINLIAWNRNVFMYNNEFGIYNPTIMCHNSPPPKKTNHGWLVLQCVNPCRAILCQSQFWSPIIYNYILYQVSIFTRILKLVNTLYLVAISMF